jgi:hypothetical protein
MRTNFSGEEVEQGQQDGRTILEKARERKKKTNLEGGAGISKSYNTFSILSADDVSSLAECAGISLGADLKDKESSILEIQEAIGE